MERLIKASYDSVVIISDVSHKTMLSMVFSHIEKTEKQCRYLQMSKIKPDGKTFLKKLN